jgi:hypothetical protein
VRETAREELIVTRLTDVVVSTSSTLVTEATDRLLWRG